MLRHATRVNPVLTTFSSLPTASNVQPYTDRYFLTDVGLYGSLWYSNGTYWIPEAPILLYEALLPMLNPTSGTMGDNGALSGLTALPITFGAAETNGCYMLLPANAIFAGSAANYYYVIMSNTTSGTVYQETYTSGIPAAPAIPTPWVCTGPGAFAAETATQNVHAYTLPANIIKATGGKLQFSMHTILSGDTNTKPMGINVGGVSVFSQSFSTATFKQNYLESILTTSGVSGKSYTRTGIAAGTGTSTSTFALASIDFTTSNVINSRIGTANVASFHGIIAFRVTIPV